MLLKGQPRTCHCDPSNYLADNPLTFQDSSKFGVYCPEQVQECVRLSLGSVSLETVHPQTLVTLKEARCRGAQVATLQPVQFTVDQYVPIFDDGLSSGIGSCLRLPQISAEKSRMMINMLARFERLRR
jgi:hypothetical protein